MGTIEPDIKKALEHNGWAVLYSHRGFPDLICFKDGKIAFVEVKNKIDREKPDERVFTDNQIETFDKLTRIGYPVFVVYGEEGMLGFEGKPTPAELGTEILSSGVPHFFVQMRKFGQITVPQEARELFKIEEGTELCVVILPGITRQKLVEMFFETIPFKANPQQEDKGFQIKGEHKRDISQS